MDFEVGIFDDYTTAGKKSKKITVLKSPGPGLSNYMKSLLEKKMLHPN